MKIKDILDLDYNDVQRMTAEELKEATREAARYANRRISTLQTHSELTREVLSNFGGIQKFSASGKDVEKLRETLTAARNFLASKTSTISGAKRFVSDVAKRLGMSASEYMSPDFDRRVFWKRYKEFMETYESAQYASRDVQRAIANAMKEEAAPKVLDLTDDQIRNEIHNIEWKRYEDEYHPW